MAPLKQPDDPPEGHPVPRRAARVILRDPTNRVLLIRYDVEGYIFWTTPGGAVEPGENDLQAALRELMEELHITANLSGPVHRTVGRFHHEGAYVENTSIFFTATIPLQDSLVLHAVTDFEAEAMRELRWWSIAELETELETEPGSLTANIFPRNLPRLLRRLQAADQ